MAALTPAFLFSVLRHEWRRLSRFLVIGISSLGLVIGLYKLISLVLWKNGPPTVQYTFVVIIVTWLNYEANRWFTFEVRERSAGNAGRFATIAIIATGLNGTLFWLGHEVLRIPDTLVIILNTALIAFFTFTSHRFITFHERPWRFFER